MNIFRKKSIYALMHKDIVVLQGDYDTDTHNFLSVRIERNDHLPYGAYTDGEFSMDALNSWIMWRGIPKYRLGLDHLLHCFEINDIHSLLENTYHVSVSDTYWIRPVEKELSWHDVSFHHHNYDQNAFLDAMFRINTFQSPKSALFTPNNALNGFQKKAWVKQDNDFYLYKGGTPIYQMEPINEWLASRIAQELNVPHTDYEVRTYAGVLVSVCRNLCTDSVDLIPARDALGLLKRDDGSFLLEPYIQLLEQHGIADARERLDDMMLLDYLLRNTDRHDQNLGILVDADTMEWIGVAPVFDTGTGLGALVEDSEVLQQLTQDNCRLFNARNFPHDRLLNYISDINRYDVKRLMNIPNEYGKMLVRYQDITHISNQRIQSTYRLLCTQIENLYRAQRRH